MSYDSIYKDKNGVDVVEKIRNGGGYYSEEEVKSFRNNEDCMLDACRKNGMALRYGSDEIKNNFNVVSVALDDGGSNIQYASESLRENADLVRKACDNDVYAVAFVGEQYRNNKDFITDLAVHVDVEVLTQVDQKMCADKDFMLGIINNHPEHVGTKFASEELLQDKDFAKEVVSKNGKELMYFAENVVDDPKIVKEAVKQNEEAIYGASERIYKRVEKSEKDTEAALDGIIKTDEFSKGMNNGQTKEKKSGMSL